MHSNVTDVATPVTFHLSAKLLDVAKPSAGVALLLISMITVPGHVASFAAGVAQLLPLLFRFLAVPRNVTTPVAIVACILSLVTVPGHMSLVTTPITEQLLSTSPTPATSTRTTGIRAVLDPMTRAATSKTLTVAVHLHNLNKHINYQKQSKIENPAVSHKHNIYKEHFSIKDINI